MRRRRIGPRIPVPAVAAVGLAIAASLAGCSLGRMGAPTREEILARILPSAVQIVVEQREGRRIRTGSGVVVGARAGAGSNECFVVTSGHVISGLTGQAQPYVLFGRDHGLGTRVRAAIASRDAAHLDLALLRVEVDHCVTAAPGGNAALGESVWVVAFPWGRAMTLASGIVSQVGFGEGDAADPGARLMVDALVSYGTSGSGVFSARSGHLLGVVEGYRTARLAAQGGPGGWYVDVPVPGQTFVTPAADIRRFLESTGYPDLARASPS